MLYSDGVHLISDSSLTELHAFCQKVGIGKHWFHRSPKFPHYDIPKKRRATFLADYPQVRAVDSRTIVKLLRILMNSSTK